VRPEPPGAAAPVLVAPAEFKETLTAPEVAAAVADGLRAGGLDAEDLLVADGGGGTMDVLVTALGGDVHSATVADPLGRPVQARWALLADGRTAVVETAEASGVWRVAEDERDAWAASTRGTGELIAGAVEAGAGKVIVAAGGSATTDGGEGALAALTEAGVAAGDLDLEVLCDVTTPWEDAARAFGPQKGADAATVARLEHRLEEIADAAPRDPRGQPLTGAAGGLAGGLWAHLGARLVPGAAYVLDAIGFDARMHSARFVITGEGRLDAQSLAGKAVGEVATRCRGAGVACHALVGRNKLSAFEARLIDLASVTEAGTPEELEAAGRTLAELIPPDARQRASVSERTTAS
jgi:glycerate 2-kinase